MAAEAPGGKAVSVDSSTLIEEVYVSPVAGDWLERLVGDVLDTYDLEDVSVTPSESNEDPFE